MVPKARQKLGLVLFRRRVEARACRRPLREHLPELTEFQQAGAWIVCKVPFGERPKVIKQPVMSHQECEVR